MLNEENTQLTEHDNETMISTVDEAQYYEAEELEDEDLRRQQRSRSVLQSECKNLSEYSREQLLAAFKKTVNFFSQIEGIDIQRMRMQFAIVKTTIDAFAEGKESVILSAPTGFGKSFYAYALTKVVEFLDKDNSSYILTPNKFLQEQYNNDIEKFNLYSYKMLKGQSNYICNVNKLNFLERACSDDSVSNVANSAKWKDCVSTCTYIQARLAAIKAKNTVFNYNYWLTTMNHVYPMLGSNAPFKPRLITIFDETHMLGNIVQDMFAVELNTNTILRRTIGYYGIMNQMLYNESVKVDEKQLNIIVDCFETIRSNIENNEKVYDKLIELVTALQEVWKLFESKLKTMIEALPTDADDKPILQDSHKDLLKYNDFMMNNIDSLKNMIDVYCELGKETIVATIEEYKNDKAKVVPPFGDSSKLILRLQCTNESDLCKKAVHSKADHKIFMSATLGDLDDYAEQTGIENYAKIEIPQIFDYTKSPIYSVIPMLSMNYRNKAQNKPAMVQRILKIVDSNPGLRGLVHTGNYELMRALKDANHPRIVTYANSFEKSKIVELLKERPDTVIAGPSLVEGVDLKDDLCRFMIWMKVPFMSMADRLTKKKMEIYRNWYNWVTMSNILQGLGRGIRNDKDWCVTYLLDSSFQSFFSRNALQQWIADRMKLMQASNIGVEYDPDALIDDINWDD